MEPPLGLIAVDDVQELLLLAHRSRHIPCAVDLETQHTECAYYLGHVIKEYFHLCPRRIAFAISRDNNKAIGGRRRTQNRGAANCEGLDEFASQSDASIVDAANLRDKLSGQRPT